MVAIHGEYNTLHLAGLPLMLEMYFHSLPFQVGDKHVPVAASADFHFDDVVKRIFRPVWLFQAVAFDIVLSASHMQAVFQGQFLADAGTAQTLVPVRYGIAVVVYAVESNMHVWMLLVEMLGDEELRILDSHPFHIFKRDACHDTVRQP